MRNKGLVLGLFFAMFAVGCSQQTEPTVAEDGQTKAAEETAAPTVEEEPEYQDTDEKSGDVKEETTESGEGDSKEAGREDKVREEDAEKDDSVQEDELNELTGTIKSFTGGYLYLQPDDNMDTLEFNLSEAELDCENGILSGDHVSVFYEGEVKGWDTSKVQVRRITDKVDKEEMELESLVGTVVDVTTNTLSIRKEDRDTISFITTGANFQCSNGLEFGNWVNITYLGKIQGNNAKNVKVISVTDTDEAITEKLSEITLNPLKRTVYAATDVRVHEDYCADSPVMATIPEGTALDLTAGTGFGWVQIQFRGVDGYVYEEYLTETGQDKSSRAIPEPEWDQEEKEMTADLLAVDGDMITVESEGDKRYEFSCVGAEISMKYGLLEGSEIVLKYWGQASMDAETSSLQSIADVDPKVVNEKTGGFSVTGTVMASGTNAMTIMSDDGAQITFTTEEINQEEVSMPKEGAYVAVVVKPSSTSNVYKALSIENVY